MSSSPSSPSEPSEYVLRDPVPPSTLTAPVPPPLSAPPPGDFWTETQWRVLTALLDAAVPSVAPESAPPPAGESSDQRRRLPDAEFAAALARSRAAVEMKPTEALFAAYMGERVCASPAFVGNLRRTLAGLPAQKRDELGGVLSALSSRLGAYLLTGYCTPVQDQPIRVREAILRSWLGSWFATLRGLGKSITQAAEIAYLQTSPLYKQITGYPDVPVGWKAGPHFEYSFLQFPAGPAPAPAPAVVDTDVVIVGSGCGGAVAAKVLAEAGHRVLVVDKGYYFPPSQLPMPQEEATRYMYEAPGFVGAEDGSLSVVAGSCWGGGGAVNWSVCLQTQGYVRREWARDHGLPFFETPAFQEALDRVCAFMGASDEGIRHSHKARVLLEGARRLGWEARAAPQNSGGGEHWCGHCHLGCGSAEKQGTAVSWLPAAGRAGAKFAEGFQVDRVLFGDGGTEATGVVGRWVSRDEKGGVSGPLEERRTREVEIRAKKVIVSCGSLWSPLVLMKSGIKNRNLGKNLHVHPCNFVSAYYDEETRPWEGGIITSYCTTFENLDGQGHGVKLEPACMLPYACYTWLPWVSGPAFKLAALRHRHLATFLALTRDRDAGSVSPDPATGRPRLAYTPSAFDRAHALEGVLALARLCFATGAREIQAMLPGVEPFVRRGGGGNDNNTTTSDDDDSGNGGGRDKDDGADADDDSARFEAWLARVRRAGNAPPGAMFSSAHQMGTCRMGRDEAAGVVDPRGRVWGRRGLYVADASVFPSASGVNPMVTNMAIADYIARGVSEELARGE